MKREVVNNNKKKLNKLITVCTVTHGKDIDAFENFFLPLTGFMAHIFLLIFSNNYEIIFFFDLLLLKRAFKIRN